MINVVEHGIEYRITFKYDKNIVELVKQVPGRSWNPEGKYWAIPKNHLGMLIAQFKGTQYESLIVIKSTEQINVNEEIGTTLKIPNIDISDVNLYVHQGSKLYQHQLDFLKYAIDRQNKGNFDGFLCADSMGLGKSLESINLALYNKEKYGYQHCLILCCINNSKYNWLNEIEYQTNGKYKGYILGSRKHKRKQGINYSGSSAQKLEDLTCNRMFGDEAEKELPYFIIINIEAIRYRVKRTLPIRDILIDWINTGKLSMIIVDEIHKNVSPSSKQGTALFQIKQKAKKSCLWVPMTGTPIVNKPTDLFMPLALINAHSISSYWVWNHYYCIYGGFGGHDIVGYKNMGHLKSILQKNMIRRLKEDVLDLPDKIEIIEYVENTPYQQKWVKKLESEAIKNSDAIVSSLNPLAQLIHLRQINGSPELVDLELKVDNQYLKKNSKLQRLLELVSDILRYPNEKIIIYSNWVEPLRTIYRHLANTYKISCYTGTMKESDRQKHKEAFISDPNVRILIGTIGSLGTSHTLTVARNVIFYDEPWTASDRNQAIDRVHRISAKQTVNIYTLITKNTIDESVHNILYSKGEASNLIVDSKIDLYQNPNLLSKLLIRD